ncbi:MAG TPA: pitrilysin family protein [Candidatus Paceibacterota bacterium]|nr:pitrilysin family protein [Candidatus Paceibacterota bacterium]
MYDPYAEFTKHVLSNGLEVHSIFWDRPWIGVEVVVHSGGREDPIAMPGLAHFVEHAVSKNTPKFEHDNLKEFFETCGGQANFGTTEYLATRYKFGVPAETLIFRQALTFFGSMLLGARIEKHVERERKVILREFNGRYPFLEKLEWDMEIRKALFKGHRLETWNRPIGRPEGFLSTTEVDLQGFYDKHYVPANISLVIIGGLRIEEVLAELEKSPFGIRKDGIRNPIPQPFNQIKNPTEQTKTVKFSDHVNFKVDQTEYKATWAFPADFPRQAFRVFNQVLGKVLFDEAREKRGLAYSIGNSYENFHDVYEYEVKGQISPDATPYIDDLVRNCISMVPLRRDVFERKLKSCKQKCLMIDLSGSGLANNSACDLISDHRIIPMQEVWDELQKVTFEQMAKAAALLSSNRQYTFITCP